MVVKLETWTAQWWRRSSLIGINARCLSRITGKSAHEAVRSHTRTYDLVQGKAVEMAYTIGQNLRMPGEQLVKMTVRRQW